MDRLLLLIVTCMVILVGLHIIMGGVCSVSLVALWQPATPNATGIGMACIVFFGGIWSLRHQLRPFSEMDYY